MQTHTNAGQRHKSVADNVINFRRNFLTQQTNNAINNLSSHIDKRAAHGPMYIATEPTFNPIVRSATRPDIPLINSTLLEGTEPVANSNSKLDIYNNQVTAWSEEHLASLQPQAPLPVIERLGA